MQEFSERAVAIAAQRVELSVAQTESVTQEKTFITDTTEQGRSWWTWGVLVDVGGAGGGWGWKGGGGRGGVQTTGKGDARLKTGESRLYQPDNGTISKSSVALLPVVMTPLDHFVVVERSVL